ncbi:MAG: sulfurtransferase TusA family protein [Candidatus Krumholzibacteriia bacterium]
MSERIDTRGLSCPQPVVLVARAIEAGTAAFEVLLDSEVSCENVRRFASSKGFTIDRSESADGVLFKIRK